MSLSNKLQSKQHAMLEKYSLIKDFYRQFRLYDLGSIALNRLTPRKGYTLRENIAYGLKSRQRLDLYISSSLMAKNGSKPLIIFVHGGAWSHGDKSAYKFVGEAFVRFGYDVAVMNYHLAPEYKFPSYVNDLAIALKFLEQDQKKLGISTEKVVLMGHSSGAFNIASLLYHPQRYDITIQKNIKAIVGIAGPYHFDYKDDVMAKDAFIQEVPYQQVMPYYFIEKNDIQHYLFLAENDQIVKRSNSFDLQEKLHEQGNHCEVKIIPKVGHISIMASVSSLFSCFYKTRSTILDVLDQALKR